MKKTPGWALLGDLVERAIQRPEETPDRLAILELTDEEYRRLLTPRRMEILAVLASEEVRSVSHLAELCGRSVPAVSRDLRVLTSRSLVEMHVEGRTRRPERVNNVVMLSLPAEQAPSSAPRGREHELGGASLVKEPGSGASSAPPASWLESVERGRVSTGALAAAKALSGWFARGVAAYDETLFSIGSTEEHRAAVVENILRREARELVGESIDTEGRLHRALCVLLAAACRHLGAVPEARHWAAALRGVSRCGLPGSPDADESPTGARPFGLSLERRSTFFKGLFDQSLADAGLTDRPTHPTHPTHLDRANRRTALGLAVNWGLRFLIAYAEQATDVAGAPCAPGTSGASGAVEVGELSAEGEGQGLAWVRSIVVPVLSDDGDQSESM